MNTILDPDSSKDSAGEYSGRCMVCDSNMEYLFTKVFNSWGLSTLDYERCVDCGFVACATLLKMPRPEWEHLNTWFHSTIYKTDEDPYDRDGRLKGQAVAIDHLVSCGLIEPSGPMLDWGSGTGDLAARVAEKGHTLFSYDQYITPAVNPLPIPEPLPRNYSLLTATAVFEHLTNRGQLDAIEGLVAQNGVLGIHLVIPREVPVDPDWVYLLPVHCAFHNWESMRRLMMQWGYSASVYCPAARMWFFFRSCEGVEERVARINALEHPDYLMYGEGYMTSNGVSLPLKIEFGTVDPTKRGLYVGCRPARLPANWTSILYHSAGAAELAGQECLTDVQNEKFDFVYSDMVAERMTPQQFGSYLVAVRRCLRPGGVHRLATTDLQRILANAESGSWAAFGWVKKAGVRTSAEYLNTVFRSWGHEHLYDDQTLMHRLEQAGYEGVHRTEMMRGDSPDLFSLDQEKTRLYVEARC